MDSKMTKAKLPDYKAQKHIACNVRERRPGETTDLKDFLSSNDFGQSSRDDIQGQSHFGPPMVVEAHSQDLTSMDIPDVLLTEFGIRAANMVPSYSEQFSSHDYVRDNEASVVIGQSINPTENSNIFSSPANATATSPVQKKFKPKKQHEIGISEDASSSVTVSPTVRTSIQYAPKDDFHDTDERVIYDVEDIEGSDKQTVPTNCAQQTQYLTSQRKLLFYTNGDTVVLIMERDSKFFFCGKLIVKVLYGTVEIAGTILTPQEPPKKVYHPRDYCFSPVTLTGKHILCDSDHIISLLLAEGIEPDFDTQTKQMQLPCSNASAVLKLQNFDDYRTKFLSSLYGLRVFPKVESSVYYHWTDPRKAEIALQCNFYFYDTDANVSTNIDLLVPREITERIAYEWCTTGRSCTLLAGAKGVGKSAIIRYLTNRLLPLSNKVVVVDLDVGQSEFLPSGCISYTVVESPLLGPAFTHSCKPAYVLYIGELNVMKCISRYVEGVEKLIDKLSSSSTLSKVPIVVNTMGFTHGIGWPLMIVLIKLIDPTNVLQVASTQTKKNFPKLLSSQNVNEENVSGFTRNMADWNRKCTHNVYMLQSQVQCQTQFESVGWRMQPFEKRDLMTVCYFSEALEEQIESAFEIGSGLSPTINEVVPCVASLRSLCIALPSPLAPPSQALTAINGNIVALCDVDLNSRAVQRDRTSGTAPTILVRAPISKCYGYGIVRGIDTERGKIYIITPVCQSLMRYVNCLQGCHPVPEILSQLNLPNAPYTAGVNTLPTSREPRRGYFRMRYEK